MRTPFCIKKLICFLLFPVSGMLSASSPLKIGVFSDPHFLSEKLMDNGSALQQYQQSIGRNIKKLPEILDVTLSNLTEEKIDILLIPGDLTLNGEKQSHLDLRERLDKLREKHIRIFVVPGNHDINIPASVGFAGESTFPTETVTPEEFRNIYTDYGYKNALKEDMHSLSYLTDIGNDIWLLGIDACLYKEYTVSSISAGRISPETEQWIIDILQEATAKNKKVIAMMHHGLVEHVMYQGHFFPNYLVEDWKRLAGTFADLGLKIIFTGHFHSQDISAFETQRGNTIYDIETASLQAYPFPYRIVEVYDDSLHMVTGNIQAIPSEPDLYARGKAELMQWLEGFAGRLVRSRFPVPEETLNEITSIAAEMVLMHIEGDEKTDAQLLERIKNIFREMDIPVDINEETFRPDFPPADKNVNLPF